MSKLEELIKELCPNGVEYKKIKDTVGVNRGKRLTKEQLSDEYQFEVYHGSKDTILGHYKEWNAPEKTTIVVNTGGIGGIKYINEKFWCSDGSFWLGSCDEISPKYLYYALSGYEDYFYSKKRVGGVPTIDKSVVEDFEIPVPPRPMQDEIVRILDNFTELTAELTDRRKQYEYYRDYLLTPKSNIEYKKISDFATITRGGSFQKSDFVDVGRPAIHYGKIYTNYGISTSQTLNYINEEVFNKSRKAQPNDIVMAVTSENVEDVCKCVAWLGNEDVAVSGHTAIIHHNQNPKYLSYYFHTSMFAKQKEKLAHGTKVIEVTPDKLNDIEIPIPPMDVQNRIVEVLDNFDKICNDFEIGLPAEVEMRQKQYEFFRDKLLTFDLNLERILQTDRQTDNN